MAGAAGIDVKMGVSGLSEFKNSLNAAKQSLKTMDAQLELTEKEFKATGDAEKYLQDKAVELNAKLEMQKTTLKNAEKALEEMTRNGVDKGSKAFQDMQREVLNAKSAMIDTKAEIENLGTGAKEAAKETDSMNTELKNIGKQVSFETVTSGISRITSGMEKAAKTAYKVGKAIVQEVLGVGSWADDINTTASVLGVDPEDLQRMQKTANIIDTDAETIIKARQKLMKGVGNGSKATMSALEALGVSYAGDAEDTFWKAGDAIMNLTDEAEQEAKANDLFGKSWHDLIPLFTAGREEYEKMNATWNVLTKDQLAGLGAMDDEYQKLQIQLEDLKRTALAELAEPLKEALGAVNGLLGDIGAWLKSDEGKATVENVVTKIVNALHWVVDNKETVIKALGAIVAGWAGLKLTGGALQVLQLVNGLGNLLGIGGASASAAGGAGSAAGGTAAGGMLKGVGGKLLASGALVPAAVVGAAVAPAEIARAADERRWAGQKSTRLSAAATMSGPDKEFLIAAAEALDQHYRTTGDSFNLLMGMKDRGTIEKAQLLGMLSGVSTSYGNNAQMELLRLWESGGEGWNQARTDALLTSITDTYVRMSQVADDITGGSDAQKKSSSEMTTAAGTLKGLPAMMVQAIQTGMSRGSLCAGGMPPSLPGMHGKGRAGKY